MERFRTDAPPARRQRDLDAIDYGRLRGMLTYALRRACVRAAEAFGASVGDSTRELELDVLLLVEANAGIKQTTLAAAVGVDRSTMVRLLDRAEESAYVQRRPSTTDRRVVPPRLTAGGARFIRRIWPRIEQHEAQFAASLTAAERRTLLQLLRKLEGRTPVPARKAGATEARRAPGAGSSVPSAHGRPTRRR
jgi:DNA-binding MarR family transcriptional regulator